MICNLIYWYIFARPHTKCCVCLCLCACVFVSLTCLPDVDSSSEIINPEFFTPCWCFWLLLSLNFQHSFLWGFHSFASLDFSIKVSSVKVYHFNMSQTDTPTQNHSPGHLYGRKWEGQLAKFCQTVGPGPVKCVRKSANQS